MPRPTMKVIAAALSIAAAAVPLSACGGSGSSDNPGYCSKRDALKTDIQGLKDVDVRSDGVQAVMTQLARIGRDAREVVASAKSDFPGEIADVQRSLDNLRTTVQNVSSSPSVQDVAFIGGGVTQLVDSVTAFVDAAAGKC